MINLPRISAAAAGFSTLALAAPVHADTGGELAVAELNEPAETAFPGEAENSGEAAPLGRPTQGTGRPPAGIPSFKPVFDDTWASVGIGAGLVPSYSGSDDYTVFPLPLIVGRIAGVGISPNGPGFNIDLLSQPPSFTPPETSFSFGPSFRFRNDRAQQVEDEVVELASELDTAIEVGVNGGVSFPGVFARRDRLSVSAQVRWDVLDAHNGMLFEPGVSYFRPIGSGTALQLSASASIVDDDFADYYYTVSPADAAATGLAPFTADGGLNSVGTLAILTFDLDNNFLNGGFSIYTLGGYTRLLGDAASTPFTADRGSANQFIGGLGVSYTF